MLHRVLGSAAGCRLHHAGQCAGPCHVGPCLQVVSVGHGGGQVFVEESDGLEGIQVADGRGTVGDVALSGMEEGVEAW